MSKRFNGSGAARPRKSSDSLAEFSGFNMSGGMGECKQDSVESYQYFADDEGNGSTSSISCLHLSTTCSRCRPEPATIDNLCRNCHNGRTIRNPRRERSRPRRRRIRNELPPETSITQNPTAIWRSFKSWTGGITTGRGEGQVLPGNDFSNLPSCSVHRSSSSDSNLDVNAERKRDRLRRREYMRERFENLISTGSGQQQGVHSPEAFVCVICERRRANAYIIHGSTAHDNTCYRCASRLVRNQLDCVFCGERVEEIIMKTSI